MVNLFSARSKERVINKVISIPVNLITVNRNQPRIHFDDNSLRSLGQSIKENGILQPITVNKLDNDSYELIAGERRLIASKLIGNTSIPAIVMSVTNNQSALLALLENLQRKDLDFFEEAKGIWSLINEHGITQDEAAKKLGKSQSSIANKLRILRLSDSIQNIIIKNNLTERHARALLKISTEDLQLTILQLIIEGDFNVRETEKLVEEILLGYRKPDNKKVNNHSNTFYVIKDVRLFANTISKAIDTMKQSGVEATSIKNEYDDMIEYIVRIPKNKVVMKKTAS